MKYCQKCGAQIANDELKFCSQCGAPLQAGADQPAQPAQSGQPAPAPAPVAAGGMEDNIAGLLCYVVGFITGIIFLVIAPYNQRPFVRFHAFQSIFFNVAYIVIYIVLIILSGIFSFISPALAGVFWALTMLVGLAAFVVWILLMYKAYSNAKFKLPIIGQIAENQAAK